jgi:hypothetical protein
MTPQAPKELTIHDKLAKLINDHDADFKAALGQTTTGSFLIALASTDGTTKGVGESLPVEERFNEVNSPTVVIVTRATPGAHVNVAALLARYRGDNPKAAAPDEPAQPRKHNWFW